MTSAPETVDPRLTEAQVRRALRSVAPELARGQVRHVPEGVDLDAWTIDGTWIARFARDEEIDANLDKEIRLLRAIGDRLPIPAPRHELVGGRDEAWPFRFAIHRMLVGVSGEELRPGRDAWPGLADQLAEQLAVIHETPSEIATSLGVEPDPLLPLTTHAERTLGFVQDARVLDAVPPDLRGAVERFASTLGAPPAEIAQPVVVSHADVKPEHLLLTPDGGRITGLIDWADACLTAVELDLGSGSIWLGPAFADQVARRYRGEVPDGVIANAVFRARCEVLRYIHRNVEGISPAPWPLLRAQARAVFSERSDDEAVR